VGGGKGNAIFKAHSENVSAASLCLVMAPVFAITMAFFLGLRISQNVSIFFSSCFWTLCFPWASIRHLFFNFN
jgi:hypothetical protein